MYKNVRDTLGSTHLVIIIIVIIYFNYYRIFIFMFFSKWHDQPIEITIISKLL